jgi:F-box protein 28
LDRIARQHLNAGFRRLEQFHGRSMAKVKLHLPRRESERRSHPLSRHSDILTAIETRLSLLGMTYNKFIDLDLCCFIPGKVLDETFAILRVLNRSLDDKTQPARPHELLQELRDISSMAMEHFDEKMAPVLRDRALSGCSPVKNARDSLSMVMIGALRCNAASPITPASLSSSLSACSSMSLLPTISKQQPSSSSTASEAAGETERLRARVKVQGTQLVQMKKEMTAVKCRLARSERQTSTLEKKVGDQSRVMDDQKRKLDEFARKFNEVGICATHLANIDWARSNSKKHALRAQYRVVHK